MFRCSRYILAALMLAGLIGTASAEDKYKSVISFNVAGVIPGNTSSNSMDQTSTRSANVFAGYRYQLTRHHGVELTYGRTRNTQYYTIDNIAASKVHELTATYVYSLPFKQVTPYVLGGAGVLVFSPTGTGNLVDKGVTQGRAAAVYGAGVDYFVTKHIGVRAQYRGLLHKAPTFGIGWITTGKSTHTAEPSAGFVLRF